MSRVAAARPLMAAVVPGWLAEVMRPRRVATAAGGGGTGLAIGAVTHGHGWLAVVALVVVAGMSGGWAMRCG